MFNEIIKTMPAVTRMTTKAWFDAKSKDEQQLINELLEGAFGLGKLKILYELKQEVINNFPSIPKELKDAIQAYKKGAPTNKVAELINQCPTKDTKEGLHSSDQS